MWVRLGLLIRSTQPFKELTVSSFTYMSNFMYVLVGIHDVELHDVELHDVELHDDELHDDELHLHAEPRIGMYFIYLHVELHAHTKLHAYEELHVHVELHICTCRTSCTFRISCTFRTLCTCRIWCCRTRGPGTFENSAERIKIILKSLPKL
jgi:hypothetical protein